MRNKSKSKYLCFIIILITFFMTFNLCAQEKALLENNDFYDNVVFKNLPISQIEIAGEVVNPGRKDLSGLPIRQVQVREARIEGNQAKFIGAYVYQGYSLFDLLREAIPKKKNAGQFSSPIDLLVIIENDRGEKALFSWGEIFYPNVLHRIIIATKVAPIIPTATGETWPLPEKSKLVAADDLYAERNILNPQRITVVSCPLAVPPLKKNIRLYSEAIKISAGEKELAKISSLPKELPIKELPVIFFGRGRGFHGIKSFSGVSLKQISGKYYQISPDLIKTGYLTIVGADGYRAVFSVSEIFNRNDFQEILLIDKDNEEGGHLAIFVSMDFFSDRAIKAIKDIILSDGATIL